MIYHGTFAPTLPVTAAGTGTPIPVVLFMNIERILIQHVPGSMYPVSEQVNLAIESTGSTASAVQQLRG